MSINYEGLLRSATIYLDPVDNHYKRAFKEEGVYSIQEALQARNNIYTKIYPHHKVSFVNSFLKPELLKLSARWFCCKEYRTDERRKLCMLECLSVPCIRKLNRDPNEPFLADDEIMAFLLGYTAYFDDEHAKELLAKSKLEKSGLHPHMSTDADMDALFKQVYQECLDLKDQRDRSALQPQTNDGLQIIERYFSMYFSRNYDVTLFKSPELLARLVNPGGSEEDERDFWSFIDEEGNKHSLLKELVLFLTSSRDKLGMTELWKNPVREVFEAHGIK